ncbi:hypothetical protein SANA_20710 [Gottschalkiaceae bacterium SANA]|nr:hypothetical protein SANA_20710 [Gottschalkiaceae bacterium SANA]
MKKRISVLLVLVLVLTALIPSGFAGARVQEPLESRYGDVADIGPWLRFQASDEELRANLDAQIREAASKVNFDEELVDEGESTESSFTYDGGNKFFLGLDSTTGSYTFKTFTLRSLGTDVEVWVADDIAYLEGDPRDDPIITQEQVDRLRDEFDNNIYPTDTEFFGMPDSHYGTDALLSVWELFDPGYYEPDDGIERNIILVDNVRDESFYDDTYPFFIAGFYSPTFEAYFDRNIISLDTNSWETRLESTFFGTTAHEYQHLIHDDNDPHETTWLNEGMSDFAEYLCGYGHPDVHVQFFLDHPENSLVDWDEHYNADTGPEVLADYGQAYLLQLYLHDQFGKEFTRALATNPIAGFASIDQVLDDFGAGIDFEEAFRRFCVAVVLDAPMPEKGIYEFTSIELAEYEGGLDFEKAEFYDKDGVPAWGGDYKHLEKMKNIKGVKFDGIDFMPTPWIEVDEAPDDGGPALYGNTGDEKDNVMILPVDLTGLTEANLFFNTWYEIEELWDYAMVQVSTDGGYTWASLENAYTTYDVDPDGYPAIKDNLPGLTAWSGTATEGATWMPMDFDLDVYAGQEILISFRYMTDWGTTEMGWFVKDIEVQGVDLGIENGSLDGFFSLQEITETYVDYQVVFISKTGNRVSHVVSLNPMNISEMDAIKLKQLLSAGETYMIVWYPAPVGTKGYVDFTYELLTPQDMKKIPALPYGPEEPFGPEDPVGPEDPGEPIGPDDPIYPEKPNKPGKPDHPVHPGKPIK